MRVVVLLIAFYLSLSTSPVFAADKSPVSSPSLQQQRAWYQAAEKALSKNQTKEFQRLLEKMGNYPLKPYLEYGALTTEITNTPRKEIDNFLARYPNSLLSSKLTQQWLKQLALQQQWDNYIHYYDSRLADTELRCWYLEARIATEDLTALDQVADIWNQGKSLPSGCDNILSIWEEEGYLTKDLIWQRFKKAITADNSSLANLLATRLPAPEQSYALAYQQVDANPLLLKNTSQFKQHNHYMSELILHGINRLSETDARKALRYFKRYSKKHQFNNEQLRDTITLLCLKLIKQNHSQDAVTLASSHEYVNDPVLLDNLLGLALAKQDWERVNAWLQRYSDEYKKEDRWRYWMARVMSELGIIEYLGENSQSIYTDLSTKRSFYGFIAAIKLQKPFSMLDSPMNLNETQKANIESHPGIIRAKELYFTNKKNAGNQEWFFTLNQLSSEQIVHAAHLPASWGNHLLTVQTFSVAKYYNDLTFRFPIEYESLIKKFSEKTLIDKPYIFAIVRQESVFVADAKSSANALGLMQLLHSTAQQTAKRYKIHYRRGDLVNAEKNIAIGSHYLKDLLGMYENNYILATAAYNAGPGRVRKWLNKTQGTLPFDVWIETIPFGETRKYVQNVLAFRAIYGYRLGLPQVFLSEAELEQLL